MKKRLDIGLSNDDIEFIKWMAERDNVTFRRELEMIFYVELEHCKELYYEEMIMERG